LNTDDFIRYFESYFPNVDQIDWHSWLYTPGMPPVTLDFSTKLEEECRQLAHDYASISSQQLDSLNANQISYLLNLLLNQSVTLEKLTEMNRNCQMTKYSNCEIAYRWYQLCIRVQYKDLLDGIFQFLGSTSRMKYLKVMYTEFKVSWPEMMPKVIEFFRNHQQYMHPIAIEEIRMRLFSNK